MNGKDKMKVLAALDGLALSLPRGFRWPNELRRAYERAVRLLVADCGPVMK